MRLLLDTHIALWAVTDDLHLSEVARALIVEPANEVFISVAAIWEIAIKHAVKRRVRAMPVSAQTALNDFLAAGFIVLDIIPAHVLALEALPGLHGDPFDRIMVAQALSTPLRLLTHDTKVAAYSDTIIVV
jgi:PIN domain nuclease of toxin-antitoxin system